jgi:hypothetical protein
MMRKLVLICCFGLSFSYAFAQVIKDTVRVANHAKSQMARMLDTCSVKLQYSPKDIKNGNFSASYEISFFKQPFKNKILYSYDAFRCCNFTIPAKHQHLGVSEFIYKHKALANRVFRYLKSNERSSLSEIYIKFKPIQIGNSVFIVLTETPDNAPIKNLFNSL